MMRRDPEFFKRLLATFRIEAEDHLRTLSAGLIELEQTWPTGRHAETVETIFREAHSLKGAARAVNHAEIEMACQAMEEIFAGMKRGEVKLSSDLLDLLHQAIDNATLALGESAHGEGAHGEGVAAEARTRLSALVRRLRSLPKEGAAPPRTAAEESRPVAPAQEPPQPAPAAERAPERAGSDERPSLSDTIRISAARMDALLLAAEELISARQAASRQVAEILEIERALALWRKEWVRAQRSLRAFYANGARNGRNGKPAAETAALLEFVEWNRGFMESLEEEVASTARAAERDSHALRSMVEALLQDMKQILMLPFSSLLEVLPVLVRDLAREQAKEVATVITGAEVEVERRILQELKDPLIHLVRNSIDHGIEKREERLARGKPPRGTISVAVTQREDSKVELIVADDGAGIDVTRVREAAQRLHLISAESAAAMNEQALAALVFHSGLSTSPIITDLSGRGLGLTIVREKVERLGGTIALETAPGAGTTFRIVLPTTVATMRGVLVRAQGRHFVFPATFVERVGRVPRHEVQTVENRETVRLSGTLAQEWRGESSDAGPDQEQVVSLAHLAQVLQLPGNPENSGLRSDAHGNGRDPGLPVVLAHADGRRMAFVVDEIIGEQEVLVKGLGPQLARVRNIAGATVLGTGQVVPILHVSDLLKSAILALSAAAARRDGETVEARAGAPPRRYAILVVEDSITARMQLQSILELAGYDVQTAVDGMDGMLALRGGKFDLVVSDVEMPRLDGFELTAKIRADARLADLPVVLVTALDSAQDRERGIDVGADAYIVKSDFDQSNLLDVIRRLLAVSQPT